MEMELNKANIKELENRIKELKQKQNQDMGAMRKLKTSELIDIYPTISDDDSIPYMEIIWERFPFDVWDDQKNENDKRLDDLQKKVYDIQKVLEIQVKVIKRIDRLTEAILKWKKKK